jgi:predicted Zn-dependent peptidase
LYGNHAYGNVINGNKTTVSKLTMNDLKDFYNTNYKANGAAISVVGDFDSNNMKAVINQIFLGKVRCGKRKSRIKINQYPYGNKVL